MRWSSGWHSAQKELLESNEGLNAFYSNKVVNTDQPLEISDDLSDKEQESVLGLIEHGLVFNADGGLWTPEEVTETVDTASNKPAESNEETASKDKAAESKSQPAQPKKQRKQSATPKLTPKERIAREKKMRLKYLKKQAKKKKKKR